jgi:formylmethanofuran dehydrogenase subunit E
MDETLKTIEQFHGHLGPYAVLGYKMGKIACKQLGSDPFEKTVTVSTGTTPPISCIIDGIQLGSGCTLGKGNISVKYENMPKAEFSNKNGKKITITLQKQVQKEIEENVTKENIISYSEIMYNRKDTDLFQIE